MEAPGLASRGGKAEITGNHRADRSVKVTLKRTVLAVVGLGSASVIADVLVYLRWYKLNETILLVLLPLLTAVTWAVTV